MWVTAAVGLEPTRLLHPAVFKTAPLPLEYAAKYPCITCQQLLDRLNISGQ